MKLVTVNTSNELVTSSEVIASETGNQHKNVLELIRQNINELGLFGQVAFQTRLNTQGSATEIANLNERQATLLITFMRNSATVKQFKIRLVQEFYRMAQELQQPKSMTTTDPLTLALQAIVDTRVKVEQQQLAIEAKADREEVEHLQDQIKSVQHKLTNRCNHVGYMFWTDVKRKHCPKLSDDFVKKMLTIEGVRTKMDTFLHNGFVTQVQSVLECDFLAALDEVMTHSIQVSPQFKEHPYLGRFKSK